LYHSFLKQYTIIRNFLFFAKVYTEAGKTAGFAPEQPLHVVMLAQRSALQVETIFLFP
jgi:hypothetical protein